ncbi:retrovirus-related pol polyprotein from transposon TNT 1-94 [Tanacetum coccineum]
MLEKENYIPWESRFKIFLDNKLEDGERMWNSIQNRPYQRPMIPNPYNTQLQILEQLSKMTEGNKKQYIFYVRVMNYLPQAIPNDIYNSVDASKEGESLESVYERLTMLVNIMDRNNVRPVSVSINTKFVNCLQPEWSKYVTIAKKAARNHDPLALIAYSNAFSSQYYANSSYSPQPYYVTHPSSVIDYDDEYQGELQGDSQEDKLITVMMLLAQCYNCNEKGHYASECQKPKVHNAKYFRKQMLLAMKDEARSNLTNEESGFMLDSSYGEDTLKELTDAIMLMTRLQPADDNAENVPSYDAKAISEVNTSSKVHEQVSHMKRKTIIQTTDDDQIDSSIIFDDPFVENNGGTSGHDSNAHDEYHDIKMLAYNVQKEAENQKCLNDELRKKKVLLQQELKTYETLEDAEEIRLKMRNKMVQNNYRKLNALYETFVPQQEFSAE